MAKKLDPAEKVARVAAALVDAIGPVGIQAVRDHHDRVKGVGGTHFISNGRLVALADAVEAWRTAKGCDV